MYRCIIKTMNLEKPKPKCLFNLEQSIIIFLLHGMRNLFEVETHIYKSFMIHDHICLFCIAP